MNKKAAGIIKYLLGLFLFAVTADFIAGHFFCWYDHNPDFRVRSAYYHHDLLPFKSLKNEWGNHPYSMITNSLGFRDASMRWVDTTNFKHRILLMGDSFTEGVGCDYEKTFAGILTARLDSNRFEVLNAAAVSYAPRLYYLKLKFLLEKTHLRLDEVFFFVDISDIQDEISYDQFTPRPVVKKEKTFKEKMYDFFYHHSLVYNRYINLKRAYTDSHSSIPEKKNIFRFENDELPSQDLSERSRWTYDTLVYKKWGQHGLELALHDMQRCIDLCKANHLKSSVAVYPWPDQIKHGSQNCMQVEAWKNFSTANGISFINYFPLFADTASITSCFFKGDVHWNEAGHKVIASQIKF